MWGVGFAMRESISGAACGLYLEGHWGEKLVVVYSDIAVKRFVAVCGEIGAVSAMSIG